ncbi:MAG: hypothetical protein ACR2NT_13250 [Acidimicrobiia bacterium]|nr:hypothetical protein [Acidimicrobiia bacterium]
MGTAAPQLGHFASATGPTMKVKSHSAQVTRGEGGSGGRGTGVLGGWAAGGGAAPGAARTEFTEPQTGQVKRPGPGTSN